MHRCELDKRKHDHTRIVMQNDEESTQSEAGEKQTASTSLNCVLLNRTKNIKKPSNIAFSVFKKQRYFSNLHQAIMQKNTNQAQNKSQGLVKVYYKDQSDQSDIDYEYFFATLKNYPEEPKMPNQDYECPDEEEEEYDQYQDKKKKDRKNDRAWRTSIKVQPNCDQTIRRKSQRIEKIQEKSRLEAQMEELRFYFYCARYRYQELFCKLKLSYLSANCLKVQQYAVSKKVDIPKQLFQGSAQQKASLDKAKASKKKSLMERIVKQH